MSDETNVTPIKKRRRASTPSATRAEDWTPVQIQNDIINYIARLHVAGELEDEFPYIFSRHKTMKLNEGDLETIFRIGRNKEVDLVPQRDFELLMTDFYRDLFDRRYLGKAMSVSTQHATTSVLIKYLERLQPDDVKIFAYPHEDFYCWKKLDFRPTSPKAIIGARSQLVLDDDSAPRTSDPESFQWVLDELKEECPAWYSVIERCGNAEALMAWFGSLFERDSRNPQFIYMYGKGGDSKGTIAQTLQKIFGRKLYHAENLPDKGSGALRFFSGSLEGKLLLICPDNGMNDVFSPFMMALTGGDPLAVEKKGKQTRNATNHVRTLILSNHRPIIPNKPYAKRRIILVPMRQIQGAHEANYEERLLDERVHFFSLCNMVYQRMPSKMQITQDEAVYKDNSVEMNDVLLGLIEKYFKVTSGTEIRRLLGAGLHKNQLPHVSIAEFDEYITRCLPRQNPKKVRHLIAETYGLSYDSELLAFPDKKRLRALIGVELVYPERLILRLSDKDAKEHQVKSIP